MSAAARAAWIATAAMAAVAVLLWLNLREVDALEFGSAEPVDGRAEAAHDLRMLLPRSTSHAAPGGAPCEHALEVVEQKRDITLRDPDGWYRVFWAADDTYHYKELVHLAADLQDPAVVDPAGTWTLRVRAKPEPCGAPPGEASVTYRLLVTGGDLPLGDPGPLGMRATVPALAYRNSAPHLPAILSFAWVLGN
jgi:hypothetical protein